MDSCSNSADKDQLYATMCSVISKRKKCPALLMSMDKERVEQELKLFDSAKVELDEDVYQKEVKLITEALKKQISELPPEVATAESEARYLKAQSNMENIVSFLKMREALDRN